jgi:nicotinamidase-related amidase
MKGFQKMIASTNTALLIIDMQKELFEKSIPIYNAEELLENTCVLIDQAHRMNIPVFFIQHSSDKILLHGTNGWQFHPKLHPLETDHVVEKHHGNAFEETSLKGELDALDARKLVITGLVTHGCVKATCLGAQELGYEVILVKDGHSNYHKKAKDIIDEWNQKLSQGNIKLMSTQEINFQKL